MKARVFSLEHLSRKECCKCVKYGFSLEYLGMDADMKRGRKEAHKKCKMGITVEYKRPRSCLEKRQKFSFKMLH